MRLGRVPELVLQDGVLKLIEKDYDGARAAANEVLSKNPEEVRAARLIWSIATLHRSNCRRRAKDWLQIGRGAAELGRTAVSAGAMADECGQTG